MAWLSLISSMKPSCSLGGIGTTAIPVETAASILNVLALRKTMLFYLRFYRRRLKFSKYYPFMEMKLSSLNEAAKDSREKRTLVEEALAIWFKRVTIV